jgi:hypothetical protein
MANISEKEVKIEVSKIQEEMEMIVHEAKMKGLEYSVLSEEELVRKIKRETSKSPYIYAQSWTSGTHPGSPAVYTVYISNPDPGSYYPMFVTIFFGLANFLNDISGGLAARNTDWPYISSESFSLASGSRTSKTFRYTTPASAALGTYLGNSIVWRGQWHDKGTYFDRGLFRVTLS